METLLPRRAVRIVMSKPSETILERLLDRCVACVRDRKNPAGAFQRWLRRARLALKVVTWLYCFVLVTVLGVMEWRSESFWLTSFLMFFPVQGWLLPLIVLTPLCLLFSPRLCLWHLGAAIVVLLFFMGYKWTLNPGRPGAGAVTLVTNNIGENNKQSLTPFITDERPDLIVLEDAMARGLAYKAAYTNHHVRWEDQFVLISRWPVKDSGVVPLRDLEDHPIAAWFDVDREGLTLRVYAVHFPSPRRQLEGMRGLGVLAAAFGREGRHGSKLRVANRDFWNRQVHMANEFVELVARETIPCIVAGDFNVPGYGRIYHTFARQFTDAFAERGRGYGFTFPGTTRNPLTLFGPWMRLDYVFSNASLRPVYCRAESDRKSQHRAVVASFDLKP
jgi:vancomycin resistance protein VanJ